MWAAHLRQKSVLHTGLWGRIRRTNFRLPRQGFSSISDSEAEVTGVLVLDGNSLTPDSLCNIYVEHDDESLMPCEVGKCPRVEISEVAWDRVRRSGAIIQEKLADRNKCVYGVTTGFGSLRNIHLPDQQLEKLQVNLVRSHAAGVGSPLSISRVKRLLTTRINILAKGYSGVQEKTLRVMLAYLNKNCLPYVPERGSVGCSGDLAPSAHMALGLIGEGKMWNPTSRQYEPAAKVAAEHGLEPLVLSPKEGLALINGTQLQSSLLAESLVRARVLARQSDLVAGCTLEALRAVSDAFIPEVHEIRGQKGQIESAARIRNMMDTPTDTSELSRVSRKNVQDAYSMRCTPQVHGVVHDTIEFCWDICARELNAACDNPLVMPDGRIVSAGNFHGEYPGKACDYLAIGVTELAGISERRIERMLNPSLSGPTLAVDPLNEDKEIGQINNDSQHGMEKTYSLPPFLMPKGSGGLNSGFMIPHCTAAALVSENKVLCHPATVDSISTSAAQEDHVSMGPWAAIKLLRVVENVERVVAIELLAACQALDLTETTSTKKVEAIKGKVREGVKFWEEDQIASIDMDKCFNLLRNGSVLHAAAKSVPCGYEILDLLDDQVSHSFGDGSGLPSTTPSLDNPGADLSLALFNATLVTMAGAKPGRWGAKTASKTTPESQNDIGIQKNAAVVVGNDGRIVLIAPTAEAKEWVKQRGGAQRELDCNGRVVMPGFVDGHTHAVYSGDRSQELAAKMSGESYASLTARGGGIHFTVDATRQSSQGELERDLQARLDVMLLEGTTTVEVKSGYGLDVATEMRMLRAIHNVSKTSPMKIVSTFLGAHAVPRGLTSEEATENVCGPMLEELQAAQAAKHTSVSLIDSFCEDGFFDQDQTRRVMEAGNAMGLLGNFHGDELTDQDSGLIASKCENVIAVSHLEYINDKSIKAMADNKVIGVALPSTAFLLRLPPPPVRKMIDNAVAVALATDYNPNCPVMSMPVVMNQACVMMGMTMQEALNAATINAAAAIAAADEVGSIEIGKRGDLLLLSSETWEHLVYLGMGAMRATPTGRNLDGVVNHHVAPLISEVYIEGRTVASHGHICRQRGTSAVMPPTRTRTPEAKANVNQNTAYHFLAEGIPAFENFPPPATSRDPSVPHSPKRPINPSSDECRLALRNALRYFPKESHELLGQEFLAELKEYNHIYMYRFRPRVELKAWNVNELPGRCNQAKALMHMILNNLDSAVAQFPHELVTYGGTGSVFQNWAQFRLTMKYLSEMTETQTLALYSGHPMGLFSSHRDAPRIVVTNGMVVPNYSSNSDYERYYLLGVSQYGQMTAGSFCYIGPQGIVHGTAITLLGAGRKYLGLDSLRGKVFVTAGLGGMSGAQPKAAVICGAIGVVAEVNRSALLKRYEQGWLTEWSDSLDVVIDSIRKYQADPPDSGVGVSIGYLGNVVELWERLAEEKDLPIELGSDQTSCHLVYGGGYYPVGLSFDEAETLMAEDNATFCKLVDESLRRHIAAINTLTDRGMRFWDYGNAFLLSASRANADVMKPNSSSFKYPSYVEDIMGDIFSLGFGPFRWVCTSALSEDLAITDRLAAGVMRKHLNNCTIAARNGDEQAALAEGCFADNLLWIEEAGENKLVVGSQARILYADAKARVDIALEMNAAVGDGRLQGPVVISRDHHDVSGVDSPWRETSNITDGSRFCADMAVHNFVGDSFRGASLVALHNGGGTGFGEAMNGGFCLVLDGTADAAKRASMMLHWDVFNGISRRAWDGNSNANLTIASEMSSNPAMQVTKMEEADPSLLDSLVSRPVLEVVD